MGIDCEHEWKVVKNRFEKKSLCELCGEECDHDYSDGFCVVCELPEPEYDGSDWVMENWRDYHDIR
jgi:hypothetical protein